MKKIKFLFSKKTVYGSFTWDKGLQWVNKKQAIWTDLGIFRHSQAYLGFIHITMAYLEPWYI